MCHGDVVTMVTSTGRIGNRSDDGPMASVIYFNTKQSRWVKCLYPNDLIPMYYCIHACCMFGGLCRAQNNGLSQVIF